MRFLPVAVLLCVSAPSLAASDWEKFYTPMLQAGDYLGSEVAPEEFPSTGNVEADLEAMWRRGYTAVGYSYFNSSNSKTKDAFKLAKKLKVRYLIVLTDMTSSSTANVPITVPKSSTTYTTGTATISGSNGSATGNYSGSSTTYGSSTTIVPITINRFDKFAAFFVEAPKLGAGVQLRDLTNEEVSRLETRRATAIRWVRDGSPAYNADLLPGDIILKVNGEPFDREKWWDHVRTGVLLLQIDRNGKAREIELKIPVEWRPQSK